MDYAKKPLPIPVSLFCALSLVTGLLFAQPQGNGQQGNGPQQGNAQQGEGQHRKPPQEALDACKSLKAGQDCSFTSPHGAETGTCFAPEGRPLACRPKNVPNGGPPANNNKQQK